MAWQQDIFIEINQILEIIPCQDGCDIAKTLLSAAAAAVVVGPVLPQLWLWQEEGGLQQKSDGKTYGKVSEKVFYLFFSRKNMQRRLPHVWLNVPWYLFIAAQFYCLLYFFFAGNGLFLK